VRAVARNIFGIRTGLHALVRRVGTMVRANRRPSRVRSHVSCCGYMQVSSEALVTVIFVAIFIFDADLDPAAGCFVITGVAAPTALVGAVHSPAGSLIPVPVPAEVLVAVAIIIAVSLHLSDGTNFTVRLTHGATLDTTHPAVAIEFTVIAAGSIRLRRLIARLRGGAVGRGENGLRGRRRRFGRLLSKRGAEAR
jgi:hypothetical protein